MFNSRKGMKQFGDNISETIHHLFAKRRIIQRKSDVLLFGTIFFLSFSHSLSSFLTTLSIGLPSKLRIVKSYYFLILELRFLLLDFRSTYFTHKAEIVVFF